MKKAGKIILLLTCVSLFFFLLGFLLGRNSGRAEITISVTESAPTCSGNTGVPSSDGLTNINTATQYELMALPGIGETIARRIIEYRETNGPYPDVDALLNVAGIGEGTLSDILDYITTGG